MKTAESKFQSVDASLAARKKADAEFKLLAPFYATKDGLTLRRSEPKHIQYGMIKSMHDSSLDRWKKSSLQHIQTLLKQNPDVLNTPGGPDNRLPVYYACNYECGIDIKYYIVNQMIKKFDYENKLHAEEKAMIQHLHDHKGWKVTSIEHLKKLIKKAYAESNSALLKNGGINKSAPIKYAVDYSARQKIIDFLADEMVKRHRELKTNEIALEQTTMIKDLWESNHMSSWPHTTVKLVKKLLKLDPGALLQEGGKACRLPIFYAVHHRSKTSVKDFILTEMVMSNQYKTKHIALKTTMIKDLWDNIGWRETTVDVVKELVMANRLALNLDRYGNETNGNECTMVPLKFAVSGGARLDIIEWICDQMGIEKVKRIKDSYSLGTLLHCATRCKHHHLIPYLLFIHPKALDTRDLYGKMPIDYAKDHNDKKAIDMLTESKKTMQRYKDYSVVRIGYSPIVKKRSNGKFYPSPRHDDLNTKIPDDGDGIEIAVLGKK
eukprot:g8355.t1